MRKARKEPSLRTISSLEPTRFRSEEAESSRVLTKKNAGSIDEIELEA